MLGNASSVATFLIAKGNIARADPLAGYIKHSATRTDARITGGAAESRAIRDGSCVREAH